MDRIILWVLFIIGIVLFCFSLRKPLIKDTILVFLFKAYFSTFFGVIVVEKKMIEYPVRFLSKYFEQSLLFEYFLYPIVCVYFYQTSYRSKILGIILQCTLYSAAITVIEVLSEKYTGLIKYHTWTWMYSFISVFILSLSIRLLMQLINKKDKAKG
ncbi:hypothetical protein PB1_06137 [Bacillus methanolicus PB1]|uniref:Uncharacterized protein n=1 Tax=Bacillus methanolicus PB1 TaxID=997296 RepID=I3E0A0_BACMT|nr:CBO0543 family protein [Bacillus methanolicus]EIJ79921.1 hypothetical protein PB1_06137 [Bacillus methanolicus PB1]